MDTLSRSEHSQRMALVRGKDTQPEKKVRSIVHGLGYRYRVHVSKLPGKPDLVFPKGLLWHRHHTTFSLGSESQDVGQTARQAQSLTA